MTPVRGDLDHQSRLHAVTHLTLQDLRGVDQMEIDTVKREARAKALDECEEIARLHQTYNLADFPPEFNGAYRGAAQNIGDAIAALKDKR